MNIAETIFLYYPLTTSRIIFISKIGTVCSNKVLKFLKSDNFMQELEVVEIAKDGYLQQLV